MKTRDVCQICSEKQDSGGVKNMIAACKPCYKRQDTGRVHESCLRNLIVSGDCESSSLRCSLCKQPYKIEVKAEWNLSKLMTWPSIKRASSLCVNIMIFLCFLVSMSTLGTDYREHPKTVMIVALFGVGVGISTVQAVMVLYRKWKFGGSLISVMDRRDG